ncbi:hypothetical protein HYH03_011700 [Edaphochlamys debaryana]|uniref:SGNH hydrolase-type esterase domain-containing protein n=1 Tax=Edaphochlamys debaryana TaxID=47281 RepID=A0A836BW92_9CHLO|nr:hypothetical protein HYH03_011700 [Edaphochlamys debaryana]|eukprot:KAG2489898.1 hypothetical protein HYH03_011700 [Edaphochlamys debaryana]
MALLVLVIAALAGAAVEALANADSAGLANSTTVEGFYAGVYWSYNPDDRVVTDGGDGQRVPGLDARYRFVLDLPERENGVTYRGTAARLRLLLERVRAGQAIRVGALGASITAGQGVGGHHELVYAGLFTRWLNAVFPPSLPLRESSALASLAGGAAAAGAGPQGAGSQGAAGEDEPGGEAGRGEEEEGEQGGEDGEGEEGGVEGGGESRRRQVRRRRLGSGQASGLTNSKSRSRIGQASGPTDPESRIGRGLTSLASLGPLEEAGPREGVVPSAARALSSLPSHRFLNGAVAGTSSGYMSACFHHHLPPEVDLVLVEYSVNDPPYPSQDMSRRRAFERLLRKALALPFRPAVVLVHMFGWRGGEAGYWETAERDLDQFASYYGLSSVSLRAAMLPSAAAAASAAAALNASAWAASAWAAAAGPGPGGARAGPAFAAAYRAHLAAAPPSAAAVLGAALFAEDPVHPGRGGHVVVAELLATLCLDLLSANDRLLTDGGLGAAAALDPSSLSSTSNGAARPRQQHAAKPWWQFWGRRRRNRQRSLLAAPLATTTESNALEDEGTGEGGGEEGAAPTARGLLSAELEGEGAGEGPGLGTRPPLLAVLSSLASRPLPHPMLPGNYEAPQSTCYIEHLFPAIVQQPSEGWEWTHENRGKWGFVAQEPGKTLRIKLDTRLAGQRDDRARRAKIILGVAYLESYRRMGRARVSCESGCSCRAGEVDSLGERRVSLTNIRDFQVTQHAECVISITTLGPGSGSGSKSGSSGQSEAGSKFKLMGIIVGEEPDAKRGAVNWLRDSSHTMGHAHHQQEKRAGAGG